MPGGKARRLLSASAQEPTSASSPSRNSAFDQASTMYAYVGRRILATLPVLGIVAVVVFAILHLSPGDPAALIAGDHATPQQTADIRAKLGLDRPLY